MEMQWETVTSFSCSTMKYDVCLIVLCMYVYIIICVHGTILLTSVVHFVGMLPTNLSRVYKIKNKPCDL